MGPRAGLDRCGKSRPNRDSIPGPSSPERVVIPTELSRPPLIREGRNKVGVRQYGVKAWTGLNWVQADCSAAHCGLQTTRGTS